ncbi:MAG: ABC transporter ATP-binding protein [Candidatus Colwellbacteria bacterium]|nr:ABC transporter ATP-binding protein/permease [Candidatus Colwellbacteria bacterium]MDD3752581.1 ABC transporter ATP-binding protein [Candidatus Colwellbacteria bacterium]MDD4818619.1 ABC transporter ATP-binding protein [Candidatus Colwellbacteria bacterium]
MDKKKTTNHAKDTLAIYWSAAFKYKFAFFSVLVSVVFASLAGVFVPIFLKKFFDILSGSSIATGPLIEIAAIIAVLKGIEWFFWRSSSFMAVFFSTNVMADLSNKAFAYLHKHSFAFFNNSFVGSLVKRMRNFYHSFDELADNLFWDFIPLVVNIAVIFTVLFKMDILLGTGVAAWLVLYVLLSLVFAGYKFKYDLKRTEVETATTGFLADTITNNANVKLWNGTSREIKDFAGKNGELCRVRMRSYNMNNIYDAVQGFLMAALEVGILFVAISLWSKGSLTVGDFVLIQSYLVNIFMRIWGFGRVIRRTYEALSDADDMTEVLVSPHSIKNVPGAKELKVSSGKISFKNVYFCYGDSDREVISGLNLNIAPGEKIALIGKSGSGKTTVTKLLLRMHDVSAGNIEIDGQDISKVTQESLWNNISLVPQDPILFHRPLIENIRYGRPSASDKEVVEAAEAANCHKFISNLSNGYNTFVGERGIKLSGGERQRVAIARAILRNAPILVLDEATSSLDSESELLIQQALERLMRGKTVIVIAHRLSTIKRMDRIIAIDGGKIAEEGSHSGLSSNKESIYGRLWKLQAEGFS